ncbi:hypothetical protein HJFPF1_12443 [Paramyrothecium foliicola]|nr:hypothetical protein HJFPF1_12443 [Paramyrothecium foliicola]
MQHTNLVTLAVTLGAAAAAVLAPVPRSVKATEPQSEGIETAIVEPNEPSMLEKRGPESVHLVNCSGNGRFYSIVVYCADDSNCNFQPAPENFCYVSPSRIYNWEGRTDAGCNFNTGVAFRYTLPDDAKSRPLFTAVGSGSNGFRSFTIYNDNSPVMFTASDGAVCRSSYYSL